MVSLETNGFLISGSLTRKMSPANLVEIFPAVGPYMFNLTVPVPHQSVPSAQITP